MGKGGEGSGDGKEENMAAWLVSINTLKIQPYQLPPLGPHDVRVRMKAVGICGSDVHYLKTMRLAHFVVKEPMIIGHECAGVIEEVGSEVKSLTVGDRVALEPGISCLRCKYCKGGRYNLCEEMKFFATPPVHGSLANQVVHPAELCFKLPDNVSLEEGAMCEPLSVGVHACRRAGVGPETNVLIMGAGPIGLVTMFAARAFGAPKIVITDVNDHRLSVAKSLGADDIVKVSTNMEDVDEDVIQIQKAMGADIDVTIDCAGFSKTMSTALNFLRTGKIDVKPLITHRFGFSQKEVEEAFEVSARGCDAIKVMFNL
uniref:Sorbitol dehydrogenase n=1 Tax=Elaeis guineensis var. tenera TaxID=51953 RepID=A0A8N4FAU4_ELAGV|nr:sorbitol dehydrogenase [Elaeis guineensis]